MKYILENPIIIALLTALLMWLAGWVRTFLAKRVHVASPDAEAIKKNGETIEKTVAAVNCLIEIKGPELDMLIALGEAIQGQNNGNVTTALDGARAARRSFRGFLGKAACIEVAD
jgi:ABC-type glucose/galactose transport system permease subunit